METDPESGAIPFGVHVSSDRRKSTSFRSSGCVAIHDPTGEAKLCLCYILKGGQPPTVLPLVGQPTLRGRVAQLAEHSTLNRQVEGSIPSASTNFQRSPSIR